jgi:catechol 2,3-dioxygenase-like lactoylglutathione lyase family enzyme
MMNIKTLDHLVVNVRDVEASAEWYGRVLGMKREDHQPSEGIARTSMNFGTMKLNPRPVDLIGTPWFTATHPMAGKM